MNTELRDFVRSINEDNEQYVNEVLYGRRHWQQEEEPAARQIRNWAKLGRKLGV